MHVKIMSESHWYGQILHPDISANMPVSVYRRIIPPFLPT
jgi:hypothetical protein